MENFTTLFLYSLIFILSYHFIRHLMCKLQNYPPSPISLPIFGHLYLLKHPLHCTLSKLSDHHGAVVLLRLGGLRTVVVSSSSAAKECLRQNDVVFANRPRFLTGDIFDYDSKTLIWAPYGQLWRTLRKISTVEILSPNPLQLLSDIRMEKVKSLIRRVNEESERSDRTVDMQSKLFDMTHLVMMKILVRERYKGEEAKRFRKVMEDVIRVEEDFTVVDLFPILKWLGFVGILNRKFKRLKEEKETFLQGLVEMHRKAAEEGMAPEKKKKNTTTLMERLIELQKNEPEIYTDDLIKGLVQVLLLAGTDTTARTIEWALSLMLNNPTILKKAQAEIDKHIGYDRLILESDLVHLPYLQCIINETLRMYPAAPLLVPHYSSNKCIVGGYTIPRGTMLLVNIWAIQNDPKVWENPIEFRPERFQEIEEEQLKFKFLPFGLGRRACPGEALAMRMLGLTLGSLLQCFEWDRVGEELVDMEIQEGISMTKAEPLRARCHPRKAMMRARGYILKG